MANYYTHLSFQISASKADAERFIQLIEAASATDNDTPLLLGRDIEAAFRGDEQSAEHVFTQLLDGSAFGIDCLFNEGTQSLTIFDSDGGPNLWALAHFLQRLFPQQLPLGFVYSHACDRSRVDSFGGGLYAIGPDTIIHRSLDDFLGEVLSDLMGPGNES